MSYWVMSIDFELWDVLIYLPMLLISPIPPIVSHIYFLSLVNCVHKSPHPPYGGFHLKKNGGSPNGLVYFMEHHLKIDIHKIYFNGKSYTNR